MELKKEKINLNLSPTSMNLYYQSPLLFYLKYIAKVPDDTFVPICYSLSGNIVHDCLERYAKNKIDRDEVYTLLLTQWERLKLNQQRDIYGHILNSQDYLNAVIKGIEIIDKHESHICEETFSFPLKESEEIKIGLKGIIDLQAIEKSCKKSVILDYKTSNSVSTDKSFERQALFYNLLLYKHKNIIPSKTVFHYLKLGVAKDYFFKLEDIEQFEKEIHKIADTILEYGNNIEKYPIGNVDDLFNSKKQACLREIERRKIN
jgi:RecB family exonuclease